MLSRLGGLAIGVLRRGIEDILILVFLIMIAAVLIQVVGRFVPGLSFAGTEEVANFAQVWLVLLGAGVAMRYGRHAMVDVLITQMPVPLARFLYVLIGVGSLWFLYIMFFGSLPLVDMGFFERAPATKIPMWTMYLSLSIGAVYFAIETAVWVVERWKDPHGAPRVREG